MNHFCIKQNLSQKLKHLKLLYDNIWWTKL
uniref:Uncharacterized protein n=1 Tax=Tetranychus urticae TaxID=32264 RepID=T1JUK1_TETUR